MRSKTSVMSAGRLGARLFLLSQGTYTAYSPECRFTKACSPGQTSAWRQAHSIIPGHSHDSFKTACIVALLQHDAIFCMGCVAHKSELIPARSQRC